MTEPETPAGAGAAGTVSRTRRADGAWVAVKRFHDPAIAAREIAMLRRAERRYGPRLLAVHREPSADTDGESIAAELEWMDGTGLDAWLRRAEGASADRTRAELAAVVAHGVGRALAELHELGIRHGDVKPANILVHAHRPRRDAADDRGATLIDLSLASDMRSDLEGATLAYLAPEARADATRVGPETDLYALGCVLREILLPEPASEPSFWADALVAPSPGGRPSAAVIADRAARFLGLSPDAADAASARKATVRRAYLKAQLAAGSDPAFLGELAPSIEGPPREWLTALRPLADEATKSSRAARIEPLDRLGIARWLTALFGSPPSEELVSTDEGSLATRLLALAETVSVFAYADLVATSAVKRGALSAPSSFDLVSGATALAAPRPTDEALAWASESIGAAPPSLALALAEAFLRVGEVGAAWLVLARRFGDRTVDVDADVLAFRADLARRRGDVERARRDAEAALGGSTLRVRSRARATLSRLDWDRGDYDAAEAVLEDDHTPFTAEMRALVAYARGQFEAGLRTLDTALAESPGGGMRARLEGVRGMLEHARGDALAAVRAFAAAVEHAGRASILDEATYLTGMAAAATDAGDVASAHRSATRAGLLWERLGAGDRAARAWLALSASLALIGAAAEARAAADEVLRRARSDARASRDALAVAYAHLVEVETLPAGDRSARDHLDAAESAIATLPGTFAEEARLRVDARRLVWSRESAEASSARPIAHNDAVSEGASSGAQWEWWGARAAVLDGQSPHEARRVLGKLVGLLPGPAPVPSKALAVHAGLALARAVGDGETARRFEIARRAIALTVRDATPPAYRARLDALPWMHSTAAAEVEVEGSLEPAQIAQLEALVRSLGGATRLAPLLDQVVDALLLWTGVERGLLLLRAPDGKLVPRAARNLARSDLEGEQRELSLGIARRALELGDVVVATDAFASLGELHASVHALRIRSVLAVPLFARGEALGVVYLDDRFRRGAFGKREVAWVKLVATHAALAVQGARDTVRLKRAALHAERSRARVQRELAAREVELDHVKAALVDESKDVRYAGQIGRSEAMRRTLHVVSRVSGSDVPVLLCGESGTGKELLAHAIHETGPRRTRAFVTENCGAVPENLLESILFGHKKGAFTGATANRPGLFEVADGGTLFLDEIGEMSAPMQAKLLRVLQDGEVRPVGGDHTRRVNVRIVAATHRDLEAMVKAGAFREDLFYRLNVVRIDVPPLRERTEDIPALVAYLTEKYAAGRSVRITNAAMARLVAFPWPGNVRQLENEIRRAFVLGGDRIDADDLSPEIFRGLEARRSGGTDLRSRLDALESELVQDALDKTRGNQTKAAEILGVSRFGLQKMIKRLGLRVPV